MPPKKGRHDPSYDTGGNHGTTTRRVRPQPKARAVTDRSIHHVDPGLFDVDADGPITPNQPIGPFGAPGPTPPQRAPRSAVPFQLFPQPGSTLPPLFTQPITSGDGSSSSTSLPPLFGAPPPLPPLGTLPDLGLLPLPMPPLPPLGQFDDWSLPPLPPPVFPAWSFSLLQLFHFF
jgi:hypothetical protein